MAEQKGPEVDDDKKEEEQVDSNNQSQQPLQTYSYKREAKPEPGDGLPTKPVDKILFKWNKEHRNKSQCDTQEMLYLLQLALNLVRLRTIERNKYFKSIGRPDRYINQLDTPQIITNFLLWHNKDKNKNKFDGDLLEKSGKLDMINDIISKIGGVKLGPATKIYAKLMKDVMIQITEWTGDVPPKKLELVNYGFTKLLKAEKILKECTVEEVVKLLKYGVFKDFIAAAQAKKNTKVHILAVEDWESKFVQCFVDNKLDGQKIMEMQSKDVNALLKDVVDKGNKKINGNLNSLLRNLKKCKVHDILSGIEEEEEK